MKRQAKMICLSAGVFCTISFISCHDNFTPKERGYYRIVLPAKAYKTWDSIAPYRFEIPVYSYMKPDTLPGAEPYWMNLQFPSFDAILHLSYKRFNTKQELSNCIEDSRRLTYKHDIKAEDIIESSVITKNNNGGMMYEIEGNTATGINFYLTDTLHHFIRGALYFNARPNIDSLKPSLDFLKKDVMHLMNTLEWK